MLQVNCSNIPSDVENFCRDNTKPCLFNIRTDPCEVSDVSADNPEVVRTLLSLIHKYNATAVPPLNKPWDPAADPKYWGYNWNNWLDYARPSGVEDYNEAVENRKHDNSKHFDYFKHAHNT